MIFYRIENEIDHKPYWFFVEKACVLKLCAAVKYQAKTIKLLPFAKKENVGPYS